MSSTGSLAAARRGMAALEALAAAGSSPLTAEQRALVEKWPGWGPLAPAFDPQPDDAWSEVHDRLLDVLPEAHYKQARECVDNSFYTPASVVNHIWSLLRAAGFTGGRVLEPGCGSGAFLRDAPDDLDLSFTGVERDGTSVRIARALHPEAEIVHSPLEKWTSQGRFDAVVGNVPFSSSHVSDAAGFGGALHNYFLRRSLDVLREGGYLVVVTSRYTLDGITFFPLVADLADFVGAVRLPSGTFHSEGTDVVADILVLRKNTTRPHEGWTPPPPKPRSWNDPYDYSPSNYYGGRPTENLARTSPYWEAHPEQVAGTMTTNGHYRNPVSVVADDRDGEIARAVDTLTARLLPMFTEDLHVTLDDMSPLDAEGRKEGSFHADGDKVVQVQEARPVPVPRPGKELLALIRLRDLALDLLEREAQPAADETALTDLRDDTLAAYQTYRAEFGAINRGTLHMGTEDPETGMPRLTWRRPTMGGFRRDPDYVLVMALERYDQDTGSAEPADILLRRVNHVRPVVVRAASPAEALAISLGESNRVDLDRVAGLLALPSAEAAAEALGDLIYRDPDERGAWTAARNYLSGNIRAKIEHARTAATTDPAYGRNVAALENVLPRDLGPLEINLALGNPVVTVGDVRAFCSEVLGTSASVERCAATASWKVEGHATSAEAKITYGTARMDALALVQCALSGKAPLVVDEVRVGHSVRKIRNTAETLAAQDKMNALQDRFATWVWEDPDRAARLCAEYNRRFNSHITRRADGAHLTFPGLSDAFIPHSWQRDMVDMAISTPGVLCGHEVGAGKTLTAVLTAVTLRKFGLASKPLVIVPNHLLEQIAREMAQAFPLDRFLVAGKEDLSGDNRRLFAARCATGDWTAVVMSHQGFTSLPVHPRTEEAWLQEQKDDYDAHLRSGDGGYFGAKEIARKTRSLESRLDTLRANRHVDPGTVLWDHLGVDYLMVDEAHNFKRLAANSRAEGWSLGESKRATDLLLKVEAMKERRPGMPYLALFTGTPWTNTLAETWVWQRYLQYDTLVDAGVDNFDAWAAVFVKRETVIEVAPDGSGFRACTRPTRMQNIPELRAMFAQVADVLSADDLNMERPPHTLTQHVAQPSTRVREFVATLAERAEGCRTRKVDAKQDNMLAICGEGRRVALDPWLVGIEEESEKITTLAENTARLYRKYADSTWVGSTIRGGFQIVFCDQGTPSREKGAQTYGRVKAALVAAGVPAARIRMIHEAADDKSRAALFAACRAGAVSVLIGSTEKMGSGTNMQTRLVAVHHGDAPYRPSDVRQRNGRALRPGNQSLHVEIARYVTEGTFDAYVWQALERKELGFAAMYRSGSERVVDDIGEVVPDFTQMVALATGNPLLLRQAEISSLVQRLRMLRAVDAQSVTAARKRIAEARRTLARIERDLPLLHEVLAVVTNPTEETRAAISVAVSAARDPQRSYGLSTARISGDVALVLPTSYGDPVIHVRVRYSDVGTIPARKSRIHNGRRSVDYVLGLWETYAEALPDLIKDRIETHSRWQREIEKSTAVIDGYSFPRAAELHAAERNLETIASEIEASDVTGRLIQPIPQAA